MGSPSDSETTFNDIQIGTSLKSMTSAPAMFKPEKKDNCPLCKGKGHIFNKEENAWEECGCRLKERVMRYLTPIYANAKFMKDYDISKFIDNNVIHGGGIDEDEFKGIFKTYLVLSGMIYAHRTVTPQDCIRAWCDNPSIFEELNTIPLLVINFIFDPPNREYSSTLTSILKTRQSGGLKTWVYSRYDISATTFRDKYGNELANYLENNKIFKKFKRK